MREASNDGRHVGEWSRCPPAAEQHAGQRPGQLEKQGGDDRRAEDREGELLERLPVAAAGLAGHSDRSRIRASVSTSSASISLKRCWTRKLLRATFQSATPGSNSERSS